MGSEKMKCNHCGGIMLTYWTCFHCDNISGHACQEDQLRTERDRYRDAFLKHCPYGDDKNMFCQYNAKVPIGKRCDIDNCKALEGEGE